MTPHRAARGAAHSRGGPEQRSLNPPPLTRRTCSSMSSPSCGGLAMEKLRRRPLSSSTSRYCPGMMRVGAPPPGSRRSCGRTAAAQALRFHPGQYLDVLLESGRRRSFSIANPPHDGELTSCTCGGSAVEDQRALFGARRGCGRRRRRRSVRGHCSGSKGRSGSSATPKARTRCSWSRVARASPR